METKLFFSIPIEDRQLGQQHGLPHMKSLCARGNRIDCFWSEGTDSDTIGNHYEQINHKSSS